MKNFQRIYKFEQELINKLEKELQEKEYLWNYLTVRTTHPQSPHTEIDDIIIRFNEITTDYRDTFDDSECYWFPASAELPIKPYIFALMNLVQGDRIGRVVITRTKPGKKIQPHKDMGAPVSYYQRFHIAIKNSPGAEFICGDEVYTPETGDVFIFDNSKEHAVINASDEDRITMIVDIKTPLFEHIKKTTFKLPVTPTKESYGTGITYQEESFEACLEECKPFAQLHWDELALTKQDVPLDFDWHRFVDMDRKGKLHFFTVRKDGKMIGYHISFISGHLHYRSTLHAIVDLYFLHPDYRGSTVGYKLFKKAEESLKKRDVKKIITGCKVFFDHTRLFESLGYEKSDYQFIKIIN